MAWRIDYTGTAKRRLGKLDRVEARRVMDYMDRRVVAGDPRGAGGPLTGPLGKFWRYRVGSLRVVCEIQDAEARVLVVRIARRDKAYAGDLPPGRP